MHLHISLAGLTSPPLIPSKNGKPGLEVQPLRPVNKRATENKTRGESTDQRWISFHWADVP